MAAEREADDDREVVPEEWRILSGEYMRMLCPDGQNVALQRVTGIHNGMVSEMKQVPPKRSLTVGHLVKIAKGTRRPLSKVLRDLAAVQEQIERLAVEPGAVMTPDVLDALAAARGTLRATVSEWMDLPAAKPSPRGRGRGRPSRRQ